MSTRSPTGWILVLCLLAVGGVADQALASTASCKNWHWAGAPVRENVDESFQDFITWCYTPPAPGYSYNCANSCYITRPPTYSNPRAIYVPPNEYHTFMDWSCDNGNGGIVSGTDGPRSIVGSNVTCGVYVIAPPKVDANCGCDLYSVGHPINPANGAVFSSETDVDGPVPFQRYYNSLIDANSLLSPGWTHSFSRSITRRLSNSNYLPYAPGPKASSLYATEEAACVSGFAEIKSQVGAWTNASASYSNGQCNLTVAGAPIGTLSLNYSTQPYPVAPTPIAFDARRDDGRVVSFVVNGSSIVAPQGIAMRLQETAGGFTLTDEKDNVETYDTNGKLLTIVSRDGVTHSMGYDASGRLATVTDSFGHGISLSYNAQGKLASVTDPGNGISQYAYDLSARLESVTRPNTTTNHFLYEDAAFPNALTAHIDENGARYATWSYDTQGRAIQTSEIGGVDQVALVYNADGSVTTTDAFGAQRTFTYERHGDSNLVVGISGSKCRTCREDAATSYDSAGFVSGRRDYNGNLTCYANDAVRGLELVRVEGFAPSVLTCPASLSTYTVASGTRERKITTTWHANYRVPTSIVEANRTTTFTHDANGNVLTRTVTDTSVTPTVSRTWTYTYNGFGQVLSENGPRTDVTDLTTIAYYNCTTGSQCGHINTITNALSQVTTFDAYNGHGQPTQITDANGLVTAIAYDARQRITDRCTGGTLPGCVGGELTHLDYWPIGRLKKVTNPDGSFIQYSYDAAHRLTQISDGALNKIVYTLDAMGNRTAENTYDPSNALKRTHTRVFNTLNQLWKDVNAAGTANVTTVFGYDNNGNQTTVNAPLSRNSTSAYDELNQLKQITDPASGNTLFGYDANDNLTSVTDPRSLVTSYTYTGFGDLKTQTSPDTGLTTNTYDSGGNLKTSTDARSAITTYTYDALNRVKTAAFKIGTTTDQTITYTYDSGTNGKGHLTGASDASHSMAWTYDAKGRVTGKSQIYKSVTPNVPLNIGYGYNAVGQHFSTVLPSAQTVSYGYNANNQVTSVILLGSPNVTIISNVTYDPFGQLTGWTWGNGSTTLTRTYDLDGKLSQITGSGRQRTFGYDDAFRITSTNDIGTPAGPSWTLGYDNLDRLNSAVTSGNTLGYTYDADGNRLTQTGTSASTYTVSANSNLLSSTSGALTRSYTYDAVGNVLTSGATIHTYNNRGRMKTARPVSTSTNTSYVYNALGQRMRKGGGTPGTVYFMYDEAGHLVGEYSWNGTTQVLTATQETVWLGDIPIATLRPKTGGVTLYYVQTDQLNTPRKVVTTSNTLKWSWDPTPFGEGVPNENPSGTGNLKYNLRFPGQYFDVETGLNYNYFRDYDPAKGGYVQSDPFGLKGGVNTYTYAGSEPSAAIDMFGLDIFRSPGNYYGDVPGPGGCESAVFAGDSLVAWVPCPEAKYYNDYSVSSSQGGGVGPSCPRPEDDYDFVDFAKDTLPWLMPELKGAELLGALSQMKRFSREKQALVEMAELDKRLGMTADDMQAYRDLNAGLPDPFAEDQVRGPEQHSRGGPHSQSPHGHVGPVHHIPIRPRHRR
jgi:RHS repeat-associated protein